jgi:hypothetical protein
VRRRRLFRRRLTIDISPPSPRLKGPLVSRSRGPARMLRFVPDARLRKQFGAVRKSLNKGRYASISPTGQSLGPSSQGRSSGAIPSESATTRASTAPSLETRVSPLASSTCCAPASSRELRIQERKSIGGDDKRTDRKIKFQPIGGLQFFRQSNCGLKPALLGR